MLSVFRRYEIKYLICEEQKARILQTIIPYMQLDAYGKSTVRNLYYDTMNYQLIRRSMEKPQYKEKLRIRSYKTLSQEDFVFVELKKKYNKVVYKRRIHMPYTEALLWLSGKRGAPEGQIAREIDYVRDFYGTLSPAVYLSYEREAYRMRDGGDFRLTFDENILAREEDLNLTSSPYGTPLLASGLCLMEIKCTGGIPLWLVHTLSQEQIYKTSFSKYAHAYEDLIFHKEREKIYV